MSVNTTLINIPKNLEINKRVRTSNNYNETPKKYFIETINFLREYFKDYVVDENTFIYMINEIGYTMRIVQEKMYLPSSFVSRIRNLLGLYVYMRKYINKENGNIYYRLEFYEEPVRVNLINSKSEEIELVKKIITSNEDVINI